MYEKFLGEKMVVRFFIFIFVLYFTILHDTFRIIHIRGIFYDNYDF
jgi:hypothetical protein